MGKTVLLSAVGWLLTVLLSAVGWLLTAS